MTTYSDSFFLAFLSGIFILISWTGWGSLIKFILVKQDIDWGLRAAWGVAFTILVGGLLNLCWAISSPIVIAYLVIGAVLFSILCLPQLPNSAVHLLKGDKRILLILLIVSVLVGYRYTTYVVTHITATDDYQGYIVFPKKMLEQGSLGPELFNDRRMSALGGHSFLHTEILSIGSVFNTRIIDPGLAYIIALALLWSIAKQLPVSKPAFLLTAVLFLIVPPSIHPNVSSMVMGLALVLSLFRWMTMEGHFRKETLVPYSLITALVLSALCTEKSTFFMFTFIFTAAFYGLSYWSHEKARVKDAFLWTAGLTILFLIPWMIASYLSSGTFLYPLLGRGYHRSAYGFFEYTPVTFNSFSYFPEYVVTHFYTLSMVLLYLYLLITHSRLTQSTIVFLSTFGTVLSIFILVPPGNFRYSYAFLLAGLPVLTLYACSSWNKQKAFSFLNVLVPLCVFIPILLPNTIPNLRTKKLNSAFTGDIKKIQTSWRKIAKPYLFNTTMLESYFKAQNSVPPGETIMADVKISYLLNFKRNRIYVVDFLVLGPKPGIPIFKTADKVADYLISQKIRYVMFSYASMQPTEENLRKVLRNTKDPWIYQQLFFTFKLQDHLIKLSEIKKKIYDDGSIFVIDLLQTADGKNGAGGENRTLDTSLEG